MNEVITNAEDKYYDVGAIPDILGEGGREIERERDLPWAKEG